MRLNKKTLLIIGVVVLSLILGFLLFRYISQLGKKELKLAKVSDLFVPEGEYENTYATLYIQQNKNGLSFVNRQEEIALFAKGGEAKPVGSFNTSDYRMSTGGSYLSLYKNTKNIIYKLPSQYINSFSSNMVFWVSDSTYGEIPMGNTTTLNLKSVGNNESKGNLSLPEDTVNVSSLGDNVAIFTSQVEGELSIVIKTQQDEQVANFNDVQLLSVNSNLSSLLVAQKDGVFEIDSNGRSNKVEVSRNARYALDDRDLYMLSTKDTNMVTLQKLNLTNNKTTRIGKVTGRGLASGMYVVGDDLVLNYDNALWKTKL